MPIERTFDDPYGYPYCSFDFFDWNPVQLKCVGFFTLDCNLAVSASTASGKTAIAEAIMGYELASGEASKAVYVSPLKAIGIEKHSKWCRHATFSRYKPLLVSSDEHVLQESFEESRMIVSTVESMLMRCRMRDQWLSSIRVLVVDEAHLIGDAQRGSACEALVMSLTLLNPSCRVILLSGTMGNCVQLAKWLKTCNGKDTRFVNSSWRPSELEKRVIPFDTFQERDAELLKLAKKSEDGSKMLFFVNAKKTGEHISNMLMKNGIIAPFFHAGLPKSKRERMLDDFRSKYSDVNVLVCTSSLSMGINI